MISTVLGRRGTERHQPPAPAKKHYWNVTELEDGTLRAEWVAAGRMADGNLQAVAGVEHAKVDAEGRITELRNEFTIPPPE
jgi:hypothetical protein